MEQITKDLQSFLVQMHYEPNSISHQMEHYIEHLFHLLSVDDERLLCQYFGLFGQEQKRSRNWPATMNSRKKTAWHT